MVFNIFNYYTQYFSEPNILGQIGKFSSRIGEKNILFGFENGAEFRPQISEIESPDQTWIVFFNQTGVIFNKYMKHDLRYGCGFHSPKNTKMLFSSKIGSFEISYL